MPLPTGLLRVRAKKRCESESKCGKRRAEACRRLAGRGDQAGGPRFFLLLSLCARLFGRDVELRYCTVPPWAKGFFEPERIVVKRPFLVTFGAGPFRSESLFPILQPARCPG